MIGYGDNAGSGIPTILKIWKNYGWQMPTLIEDTSLNQVTLKLMMNKEELVENEKVESAEKLGIQSPRTRQLPNE